MEEGRDPERPHRSEAHRDRVEAARAVEVEVLEGVEDVEAGHPEQHGAGEHEGRRLDLAAHRDPGAERRAGERQAEDQVRPGGEALGVGVAEQDRQGQGRELERQRVEPPGGEHQQQAARGYEEGDEGHAHLAGGEGAVGGARIDGVEPSVGQPVEAHRGAPRPHHRDHDPAHRRPLRPALRRQHHPQEGEGQGEERVLELDHSGHRRQLEEGSREAHVHRDEFDLDRPNQNHTTALSESTPRARYRPPMRTDQSRPTLSGGATDDLRIALSPDRLARPRVLPVLE